MKDHLNKIKNMVKENIIHIKHRISFREHGIMISKREILDKLVSMETYKLKESM